jgi:hypothetical protein
MIEENKITKEEKMDQSPENIRAMVEIALAGTEINKGSGVIILSTIDGHTQFTGINCSVNDVGYALEATMDTLANQMGAPQQVLGAFIKFMASKGKMEA